MAAKTAKLGRYGEIEQETGNRRWPAKTTKLGKFAGTGAAAEAEKNAKKGTWENDRKIESFIEKGLAKVFNRG